MCIYKLFSPSLPLPERSFGSGLWERIGRLGRGTKSRALGSAEGQSIISKQSLLLVSLNIVLLWLLLLLN